VPLRAVIGLILLVIAMWLGRDAFGYELFGRYDPIDAAKFLPALAVAVPALLLLATADGKRRSPLVVLAIITVPIGLFAIVMLIGSGLSVIFEDLRPPPFEYQVAVLVIVPVVGALLYLAVHLRD
jgi:hypothetical protein